MERRTLGRSDLQVSRLCFGLLTISPLQLGLSTAEGAALLLKAYELGVNFFDTALLYRAEAYLRGLLHHVSRDQIVICSKSYDFQYDSARESVQRTLRLIGTDYVDVFMLHEQESRLTLKGHADALRYLVDARDQGLVRLIGVSTHYVEVVRAAALLPEVDVIHAIYNRAGIGIADGTAAEMLEAVRFARQMGKGVYAMKALGGGHLIDDVRDSLGHVLKVDEFDSVAVGIADESELRADVAIFEGRTLGAELLPSTSHKRVHIAEWCEGCGLCADRCLHHAISIVDGKATVDGQLCVRCGYCAPVCPQFCIKVY